VSAGRDPPAGCGVVAEGVDVADAGVIAAGTAIAGIPATGAAIVVVLGAGAAAVGVVALDRVGAGGALPAVADGAAREVEWALPAGVPAARCGVGEVAASREVDGSPMRSGSRAGPGR
jgi:hypothetical protein